MSRYLSLALLTLLLLGGCAVRAPEPAATQKYRTFDQENDYIIQALYYKEHGKFAEAYALFEKLFEKTGNPEYRLEAVRLLLATKRYVEAEKELAAYLKAKPDDSAAIYLMALVKLKTDRLDEAMKLALELVEKDPDNLRNRDLLASIYLERGDNRKAYEVYESYYTKHHDDATVVKMASILYHKLKNSDEALRLLETHSKMVGCSENVCLFLAELYRQKQDLDHLADVYERMYDVTKTAEYAQKAAEIYAYKKEYDKAVRLLKRSHADDRLLLAIYKHKRDYVEASKLAKRLYEDTSDPIWLAEYSILLYEGSPKKSDPKMLEEVIRGLSTALKEGVSDPLYLNYLGYLLIDHDIDVKWGVELVKRALKTEPESAFYLDSLAWGYYKLGRCSQAYRQMKKVVDKLGLKDEEIVKHWKKIEACRRRSK